MAKTLWNGFKNEFLTWFGIIGLSITLLDGFDSFIRLSKVARWIVENWSAIFSDIWAYVFSVLRLDVPTEAAPFFTFLMFSLSIAMGARLAFVKSRSFASDNVASEEDFGREHHSIALQVASIIPTALLLVVGSNNLDVMVVVAVILLPFVVYVFMGDRWLLRLLVAVFLFASHLVLVTKQMPSVSYWDWSNELEKCVMIDHDPARQFRVVAAFVLLATLPVLSSVAPSRFVVWRLSSVVIGVLLLLGLNYVAIFFDSLWPPSSVVEGANLDLGDEWDDGEPGPCDGLGFE